MEAKKNEIKECLKKIFQLTVASSCYKDVVIGSLIFGTKVCLNATVRPPLITGLNFEQARVGPFLNLRSRSLVMMMMQLSCQCCAEWNVLIDSESKALVKARHCLYLFLSPSSTNSCTNTRPHTYTYYILPVPGHTLSQQQVVANKTINLLNGKQLLNQCGKMTRIRRESSHF
ncbi:hypothetical protein LOAG_10451 [Loa loa]|uniref:Uncharacterized protein n=1 Tax=Loa loa TaxID=7209 RepID=A0A1S0TPW3_LOALO|nr:hypothetical protein LOAG_10451 [Loa loa]EFO18047.1 hypothetical protein LOAG_10451 [Loa loa]